MPAAPSASALRAAVRAYMVQRDSSEALSLKALRRQCESTLGLPVDGLKERKQEITALIDQIGTELVAEVAQKQSSPSGPRTRVSFAEAPPEIAEKWLSA